jgi:hypothetical protein
MKAKYQEHAQVENGLTKIEFVKEIEKLLHMTREFADIKLKYGYLDLNKSYSFTRAEQFIEANVEVIDDCVLLKWVNQSDMFGEIISISGDSFSGILQDVFTKADMLFKPRLCKAEEEVGFMRMDELATKFKDEIQYQEAGEYAWKFFTEECDMTEEELEYFGIENPMESEDGNYV